MAFDDYRLNAQVRALLVRRWLDLSKLDYGVTNGVVYLRGNLVRILSREQMEDVDRSAAEVSLATRLERSLRRISGVRDVVFHLDNLTKVGWRWRSK